MDLITYKDGKGQNRVYYMQTYSPVNATPSISEAQSNRMKVAENERRAREGDVPILNGSWLLSDLSVWNHAGGGAFLMISPSSRLLEHIITPPGASTKVNAPYHLSLSYQALTYPEKRAMVQLLADASYEGTAELTRYGAHPAASTYKVAGGSLLRLLERWTALTGRTLEREDWTCKWEWTYSTGWSKKWYSQGFKKVEWHITL